MIFQENHLLLLSGNNYSKINDLQGVTGRLQDENYLLLMQNFQYQPRFISFYIRRLWFLYYFLLE